jgi:NADH:ubiquinone oxidoreductase subunit C
MSHLASIPQKLGIDAQFEARHGAQWLNVEGVGVRTLAETMNAIGARFITITAYELPADEGFRLEYHWDLDGTLLGFAFQVVDKKIDSIFDLCPGVDWIEREIYEEYVIEFVGRPYDPLLLLPGVTPGVNLRKDPNQLEAATEVAK